MSLTCLTDCLFNIHSRQVSYKEFSTYISGLTTARQQQPCDVILGIGHLSSMSSVSLQRLLPTPVPACAQTLTGRLQAPQPPLPGPKVVGVFGLLKPAPPRPHQKTNNVCNLPGIAGNGISELLDLIISSERGTALVHRSFGTRPFYEFIPHPKQKNSSYGYDSPT